MLKIEPGNETLTDGQTDEPTRRYLGGCALCGKNHEVATNFKWLLFSNPNPSHLNSRHILYGHKVAP